MMYIKSSISSGFEIKKLIAGQFQSSSKLVGIWTVLRCIFVPNLEIITSIGGELWHGQSPNGVNFYFGVQFDFDDHSQRPHKTLLILAWIGDELSRRQAREYHTHRRKHRQTQATIIPEGQNWPRVKKKQNAKNWKPESILYIEKHGTLQAP